MSIWHHMVFEIGKHYAEAYSHKMEIAHEQERSKIWIEKYLRLKEPMRLYLTTNVIPKNFKNDNLDVLIKICRDFNRNDIADDLQRELDEINKPTQSEYIGSFFIGIVKFIAGLISVAGAIYIIVMMPQALWEMLAEFFTP